MAPPVKDAPGGVTTPVNNLMRWLPGLQSLARYEAAWFPRDLMAGLVLTTMLVPVGIAYAVASGVPGIYGLYATIVPLLAYAVFGPSRLLAFFAFDARISMSPSSNRTSFHPSRLISA